ncbi:MAG TPA: type II toxin-antitoxin system HicA family toxin [Methylobacter sp.]|jgi:predicted RNA binding protein YcfA (HicA-like mRNA interferase family)
MSQWPSAKAKRVLASLLSIGWEIKRQSGSHHITSHHILARTGWPDFVFAFHDSEEIGPRMLARISKHTGLKPSDL